MKKNFGFIWKLLVILALIAAPLTYTSVLHEAKTASGRTYVSIAAVGAVSGADYTYTNPNADIAFALALNALPATGGTLNVLSTGSVQFATPVTVTKANVVINCSGVGTVFTAGGVSAPFIAGANSLTFENCKFDVSPNMGATTGWLWTNVAVGTTLYTERSPNSSIVDNTYIGNVTGNVSGSAGSITAAGTPTAGTYLDGTYTWSVPAGGSAVGAPIYIAASNSTADEKAWATTTGGTVCDNTADQTEINTAITTASSLGGDVQLSNGTFTLSNSIIGKSNVNLRLSPGTVLDIRGIGTSNPAIDAEGSLGTPVNLAGNAAIGDNKVSIANTSTFSVGMLVLVQSDAVWKGNAGGQYQGELQIVDTITNNTSLNFRDYAMLVDSYTTANTAAVTPITGVITNFNVIGNGGKILGLTNTLNKGISIYCAINCSVKNVVFQNIENFCIRYWNVLGGDISNNYFYGATLTTNSYGVDLEMATNSVSVHDNTGYNNRHVTTVSGGAYPGITRNCTFDHNHAYGTSEAAFDTHWQCEDISITNCTANGVYAGIDFRGYSGIVSGNIINGTNQQGFTNSDSWVTGTLIISNNTFTNCGQESILVRHPNTVVKGNSISGCITNVYAIQCWTANNCLVEGNFINQTTGGHLRAVSSNFCSFINNKTYGAANYGIYIDGGSIGTILQDNDIADVATLINDEGYGTVYKGEFVFTKVFPYTDAISNAAATTDNAAVWARPDNTTIVSCVMTLDVKYVAASLTNLSIDIGTVDDANGILVQSMNLTSDAVGTQYRTKGALFVNGLCYRGAAQDVKAYVTATGANLNTLTAGQIRVTITYKIN